MRTLNPEEMILNHFLNVRVLKYFAKSAILLLHCLIYLMEADTIAFPNKKLLKLAKVQQIATLKMVSLQKQIPQLIIYYFPITLIYSSASYSAWSHLPSAKLSLNYIYQM